jgi:RNA polymerase sigma-70 factor (ECF subfamily)
LRAKPSLPNLFFTFGVVPPGTGGNTDPVGKNKGSRAMNGRPAFSADTTADSTAVLEACIPGLRRFASALLRGDREWADDLVQDTLERALSSWHRRRVKGDPRGWLYTILYHRFLTDRRHRNRRVTCETAIEFVEGELPGVEGEQVSALEYRDLLRAFVILPEEQRSVLLLIAVEDLSYEEAARVLGVPIGTVMSRLSRGREQLRRLAGNKPDEKVRQSVDDLSRVT